MDGWVCLTNTPAVFQAVADYLLRDKLNGFVFVLLMRS